MREDKKGKRFEELADEALDNVAGGKTVVITGDGPPWECDICGKLLFEGGFKWKDGRRVCERH